MSIQRKKAFEESVDCFKEGEELCGKEADYRESWQWYLEQCC